MHALVFYIYIIINLRYFMICILWTLSLKLQVYVVNHPDIGYVPAVSNKPKVYGSPPIITVTA
jgi:hypothetical protein